MKRYLPALLLCCASLSAPACLFFEEEEEPLPGPITKKDAAERILRGDQRDYCASEGWYGDGVCDSFCPQPDAQDCQRPDDACGGLAGVQCAASEYCDYAPDALCGAADQMGTCKPRPDACDLAYMPVCGCDGQTYGNACSAASAGVSVLHDGECEAQNPCDAPAACGDIVPVAPPEQCADGSQEEIRISCELAGDGACYWNIERSGCPDPMACTQEECGPVPPVAPPMQCADGSEEQVNVSCERGFNGACGWNIERSGCEQERFCGGIAGIQCGADEFCDYEASGSYCGFDDGGGVCRPRPQSCTEEYAPVCSCDGVTYSNACSAHAAGASVARIGTCEGMGVCDGPDACGPVPPIAPPRMCEDGSVEQVSISCEASADGACGWNIQRSGCPTPGTFCGGIAGIQCGMGEYCDYPRDAMCGAADQGGVCRVMPQACPQVYRPVCGCDGVTYGNDCEAASAGVSVLKDGACRP